MIKVLAALEEALSFLHRFPNLDGSELLKKETTSLLAALTKYNTKAKDIEVSFVPHYVETQALVEGEAKRRVTIEFIKKFTKKHCSRQLDFPRADKKARTELLLIAAREGKLRQLHQDLDQNQKYREMLRKLTESNEPDIRAKVLSLPAKDFSGLVVANGLDAPRLKNGVSTSKASREKVLRQILRDKMSDALIRGVGTDG